MYLKRPALHIYYAIHGKIRELIGYVGSVFSGRDRFSLHIRTAGMEGEGGIGVQNQGGEALKIKIKWVSY